MPSSLHKRRHDLEARHAAFRGQHEELRASCWKVPCGLDLQEFDRSDRHRILHGLIESDRCRGELRCRARRSALPSRPAANLPDAEADKQGNAESGRDENLPERCRSSRIEPALLGLGLLLLAEQHALDRAQQEQRQDDEQREWRSAHGPSTAANRRLRCRGSSRRRRMQTNSMTNQAAPSPASAKSKERPQFAAGRRHLQIAGEQPARGRSAGIPARPVVTGERSG